MKDKDTKILEEVLSKINEDSYFQNDNSSEVVKKYKEYITLVIQEDYGTEHGGEPDVGSMDEAHINKGIGLISQQNDLYSIDNVLKKYFKWNDEYLLDNYRSFIENSII